MKHSESGARRAITFDPCKGTFFASFLCADKEMKASPAGEKNKVILSCPAIAGCIEVRFIVNCQKPPPASPSPSKGG